MLQDYYYGVCVIEINEGSCLICMVLMVVVGIVCMVFDVDVIVFLFDMLVFLINVVVVFGKVGIKGMLCCMLDVIGW